MYRTLKILTVLIFTTLYTFSASSLSDKEDLRLTEEEQAYLQALQKKGTLEIGTEVYRPVFYKTSDGSNAGFHYRLIKTFADSHKLELKITFVKSWSDYFKVDGKFPEQAKTDRNYRATPDILKNVDLYLTEITILDWRKKLLEFIEICPVRVILISRGNIQIDRTPQLNGLRIASAEATSYDEIFKKLQLEHSLDLTFSYHSKTPVRLQMLADNQADVTASDASYAICLLPEYPNLNPSIPISPVQTIGWATSHDKSLLASILSKFIKQLKHTGRFHRIWDKEFKITYAEYLSLIE